MAALTVERGHDVKYEAYYGAQRPGEAGETDGSLGECALIRDWIERLLPTLSEHKAGSCRTKPGSKFNSTKLVCL